MKGRRVTKPIRYLNNWELCNDTTSRRKEPVVGSHFVLTLFAKETSAPRSLRSKRSFTRSNRIVVVINGELTERFLGKASSTKSAASAVYPVFRKPWKSDTTRTANDNRPGIFENSQARFEIFAYATYSFTRWLWTRTRSTRDLTRSRTAY